VNGNNDKRMSAIGLEVEEARTAANGIEMKHRLSMLKGRLKVVGTAQVEVGDLIELKGVSARFSGKTLVTGIRHQLAGGDWFTNIQFGLSAEPFAATANIIDAKAAGLLPAVNGLQIGKVIKVDNDPLKEHRVEVMLPAITNSEESLWARISSMYAGNQTGAFFLPEIDDEVIVGFLNDDPRHPVILGSVHSSAKPAPFEANDKNNLKGIVTAAGLTISFDEEKKLITIQTSENNRITINEEDKQIEIADVNKNFIRLNKDGITIESGKDFIVKAQGEIKMEANKNVGLKGMKVDIT
jgi:Rhs element Vgr protein